MADRRTELRADIVGDDRLSGAYSRAGVSVQMLADKMKIASKDALVLDEAMKRQNTAARASVDATLALAKSDGILAEAEHVLRDGALEAELALKKETEAKRNSGDAALDAAAKNRVLRDSLKGSGDGGIFSKIGAALPAASGLVNPYTVVAGAAAAPFAGQMAAGGIVAGFGAALAGLGVLGASKTKQVQDSFDALKKHASADLAQIGKPFVPVMNSILSTASSTMGKLTPVFAGAERVIAGPFRQFGDTLVKSFNQPAVRTSIDAIAVSFGKLLGALTPQLPGMIKSVANGITNIAHAVSANPKAFADFVGFLFKAAGAALNTIAWLTRVATYVEKHFGPAMHRTAVIFDGVRHDIAHTWDQIFENSVGMVIRLGHDVERDFNDFRHRTAVIFDGARHDIAHTWDQIWNNTVGRIRNGINDAMRWIGQLPGRIGDVFSRAGSWLYGHGKDIIHGLWNGVKNVWSSVSSWFHGLPHKILKALGIASPPKWSIDAGKHIMGGILKGLAHGGDIKSFFMGKVSSVFGYLKDAGSDIWHALFGGGGNSVPARSGSAAAAQRYAASQLGRFGWGQDQMSPLIALWNQESGWNANAVNPSSGAYGIPQSLGHGHPYNLGDYANQVIWGEGYIKDRYGSPAAAWAHERAFNWYDTGYGILPPGLSLSYNGTGRPEPLMPARGRGSDGVAAHAVNYNINVSVPPTVNPRDAGRQIAEMLTRHIKGGGRIYPPGVDPR